MVSFEFRELAVPQCPQYRSFVCSAIHVQIIVQLASSSLIFQFPMSVIQWLLFFGHPFSHIIGIPLLDLSVYSLEYRSAAGHDLFQQSTEHLISRPRIATQCILLDGVACAIAGGLAPPYAQQLVCFVSANTSVANDNVAGGFLRANEMVLKRLERFFDIVHPEAVPILVGVQWTSSFDASH